MTSRNGPGERFPGHRFPQIIPDLADVRPGGVAPWMMASSLDRRSITLARVRDALEKAGRRLADGQPPTTPLELTVVADGPPTPVTVRSAVLVALFEQDGEARVVLTRRSTSLRHHGGEVALPGGRSEPGESPVETALREAQEEVALDPSDVEPFAWLSPLATFASSSALWPIVGFLATPPSLLANPDEVDQVFTVALGDLLDEDAFFEERWRRPSPRPGADADGYFPIYFFKVPENVVWGATARVLYELLELLILA